MAKDFYLNIPVNFIKDERVKNLIQDYGMKGIGILLLIFCEYTKHENMTRNLEFYVSLMQECSRAKTVRNIICNYGFFDVNDYLDITQMHISSPACTRECVPASASAFAPAAVPNNNPTLTTLKEGSEETATTTTFEKSEEEEVRSWLIDSEQTLWREQLLMRCGFGDLLNRHWSVAVDEFVQHLVTFCRLGRCYNVQVTRSYFATFCISETQARKSLIARLRALSPELCAADADEAKPKVSATPRPEWE